MNWYVCKHCGKTVERDSDKAWLVSWCVTAGKEVRIWRTEKI